MPKGKYHLAAAALAVFAVLAASAERQPFERYQSIVDRQMFGPLPPGFDPTRPASEVQREDRKQEAELTKEQEQLKSAVHFSVVNVSADGTPMVGFTDNSDAKVPRHYFLRLGEERDGWLVKEADPDAKTMTIAKGEIEVSLTLGDNSGSGGGKTGRAGAAAPANAAGAGGFMARNAGSAGLRSLQGRKRLIAQQRAADAKAQEEEQRRREAERQAAEERARLEREEREAEREEQRKQLKQIQEELRKARQAREEAEKSRANEESAEGAE